MIDLNEVSFKYGDNIILKNISHSFKKEEITCIMGSSGCGKSTLLKIIGGLEKINEGTINIYSKNTAIIFQHLALFPWMNVFENIALPLKINNMHNDIIINRVKKYLELVKLNGFENTYIHKLSGGMKQRVAIARALSTNYKIILMDEPFSALDEITRCNLQKELLKIKEELKLTIIFVTHNILEALNVANKIILLNNKIPSFIKKEFHIDRAKIKENKNYLIEKYNEIKNEI